MLKEIKKENIIYPCKRGGPDNVVETTLLLNDYDWIDHHIETDFKTEDLGEISVKFNFDGGKNSRMIVKSPKDKLIYVYTYPSDIFMKYLNRSQQRARNLLL
jgi:hypothetical protein